VGEYIVTNAKQRIKRLTEQELIGKFPSLATLKAEIEAQGGKVTITGEQTVQSDRPTVATGQTAQREGHR